MRRKCLGSNALAVEHAVAARSAADGRPQVNTNAFDRHSGVHG